MSICKIFNTILEPDNRNVVTSSTTINLTTNKGSLLPWGAHKERSPHPSAGLNIDMDIRPGEFVMRSLFADFTIQAEKKIEAVNGESQVSLKYYALCIIVLVKFG